MQLTVSGKQIDLSDALRVHVAQQGCLRRLLLHLAALDHGTEMDALNGADDQQGVQVLPGN